MEYRKKKCEHENLILEDRKHQKWNYSGTKEMQKRYPNGGYLVLADLKRGKERDAIGYLVDDDKRIELFPYETTLKAGEKCVGFLAVESDVYQETFVRIVKRRKKRFLLLLLLIALLTIMLGIWNLINNGDKPNLDENAISYHLDGITNKDPSEISIPLFTKLRIEPDTMKGEYHLANPEGNPCYFEYHIILKKDNEEVYRSGLVKPGTAIPKFTLNRKLEEGSYPAMIQIKTYKLNDHNISMNGGEIDVEIIVKEE